MITLKRKYFKDPKRLFFVCKKQVAMASSRHRASNERDTILKQPSRDKFRGCLAGAVVGDCVGSPFEGMTMGCLKRQTVEDLIGINSKKLQKKENGHYGYTGSMKHKKLRTIDHFNEQPRFGNYSKFVHMKF